MADGLLERNLGPVCTAAPDLEWHGLAAHAPRAVQDPPYLPPRAWHQGIWKAEAMFERFTDRARRVLVLAQEEARLLDHNFIGTEHLLLGLIHEAEGVAARALESFGMSLENVREEVAKTVGSTGSSTTGSPPFTPRAKKVLELSLREALQLGHNYIGPEHMLLGLVREGEGVAATVLQILGADLARVRQQVIQLLPGHGEVSMRSGVSGDLVEKTAIPVGAAELLSWDDAKALLLAGPLLADARTARADLDGIEYETCTYNTRPPPEFSLSVAGASVTREAFDEFTNQSLSDAEPIEGLADAATYSPSRRSLRVLAGTTLFIVGVARHPEPREAAIAVAERALESLARRPR